MNCSYRSLRPAEHAGQTILRRQRGRSDSSSPQPNNTAVHAERQGEQTFQAQSESSQSGYAVSISCSPTVTSSLMHFIEAWSATQLLMSGTAGLLTCKELKLTSGIAGLLTSRQAHRLLAAVCHTNQLSGAQLTWKHHVCLACPLQLYRHT